MHFRAAAFRLRSVAVAALTVAFASGMLAACQSTRAVSEVNAATHTQETIALIEEGVSGIVLPVARRNAAAWEARLRSEDVPALDDIADTLDDLEAELQPEEGPVAALATGRVLVRLAEQTQTAAAREGAPARLGRLADALAAAGAQLREAGKGS